MVIRKRGRGQVSEPEQGVVDRGVTRIRWAGCRVRLQIAELSLIPLGHVSPGCEGPSALVAAAGGGIRLDDLDAAVFLVGVIVGAAFLAGALFVSPFLAGAAFAVRAVASVSCARKLASSSRNA